MPRGGDATRMRGPARRRISLMASQMTYAIRHKTAELASDKRLPPLEETAGVPPDAAPIALDLRSLFRDSEARAARLKLLIDVSRDLAAAEGSGLEAAVDRAARKAALFAGYGMGAIVSGNDPQQDHSLAIPLSALAERGGPGLHLQFSAPLNPTAVSGAEDADALRLLVEMIEARLTVDLQRRKETELLERLGRREKELEQVLSRVVSAQERERTAISADLHDGVAQQVAALHRRLELVHLDLELENHASTAEVEELIRVTRRTVSDLRGVIAGLRPLSLDDLGVAAALREEARRLEASGHRVTILDRIGRRLPDWLETLLFRIGQEALNNAGKHAVGAAVDLDLAIETDLGAIVLTVDDDGGQGATSGSGDSASRLGLEIMRERLSAVAGRLEAGRTSKGFRIRAFVPVAGD